MFTFSQNTTNICSLKFEEEQDLCDTPNNPYKQVYSNANVMDSICSLNRECFELYYAIMCKVELNFLMSN